MELDAILKDMVKRKASDLHIRVGSKPTYRIDGTLFRVNVDRVSFDDIHGVLKRLMNDELLAAYKKEKEVDFSFGAPGLGRFRINAFHQRGTPALAIRSVAMEIPEFGSLGLPEVLRDMALKKRGLILVTGATGSGKSTALASMVDHINEHTACNIITLEDPIEFLHKDKKSMVSQREVGEDTHSYAKALRSAMRQDPDVILIGEIRDHDTMDIALTAADTGHLVMSTLHTTSAVETVSRILTFYPPHQQEQVRILLSGSLVGIVSLRLLKRKDNLGRVPACEILVNNANVKELLLEPQSGAQIHEAIQDGNSHYSSQSFDQSILRLYQDELITYEDGCRAASNPDDFELKVRGIVGTSDRGWANV